MFMLIFMLGGIWRRMIIFYNGLGSKVRNKCLKHFVSNSEQSFCS